MEPDLSRFVKIEDAKMPEVPQVASSDIYYFDADGKICDEEHAVKFVATTYDKDGNRIRETWGSCSPKIQRDDMEEYLKSK